MGISERFRMAYDYLLKRGMVHKKSQLAEMMDYSRSVVSNAYNGKEEFITAGFLQKLCEVFPGVFNYEWLMEGEGDMLQAPHLAQETAKDVQPTSVPSNMESWLMRQNEGLIELLKRANATIERKEHEIAKLRAELNQGSATYGEVLVADGVTSYGEQKKF